MLLGCTHLFYYPNKDRTYFNPADFALSPEDVWIKSGEEKIHGWWFASHETPAKGTVLFFHGNAENLSSHYMSMGWLPDSGYNYLIIDYPGYGKSTGEPTPLGCVQAGRDALNWIRKEKDPNPIIYGQSLGGNVALRVAEEEKATGKIRALVLDSTFPSYQKIARGKLSKSWVTWILQPLTYVLISDSGSPKDLKSISPIPTLVFHGQLDQVVEPEYGDMLFTQLNEPKKFISVPEAQHGQVFWVAQGKYRQDFLQFLSDNKGENK